MSVCPWTPFCPELFYDSFARTALKFIHNVCVHMNICVSWLSHTSTNTTFLSKTRLLFSHASAEVRCENTPERKVASTADRTRNHQVMSPTCSLLSHPGGAGQTDGHEKCTYCQETHMRHRPQ